MGEREQVRWLQEGDPLGAFLRWALCQGLQQVTTEKRNIDVILWASWHPCLHVTPDTAGQWRVTGLQTGVNKVVFSCTSSKSSA